MDKKVSPRPQGEAIHIYPLSRVFRKQATKWEAVLRELERDRDILRSVYAPLRIGINQEMRMRGSGEAAMKRSLKRLENNRNYATLARTSYDVFELFVRDVLPRIESIDIDFVKDIHSNASAEFEGFLIEGSFHAKVRLKDGSSRWIYVHPSKWDEDTTSAFIELLVILAENAFGATRDQVWVVQPSEKSIRTPSPSYKAVRKELVATMKLFSRLHQKSA